MQQILQIWNALDMRKRILVGAATVAMFMAVLAMSRIAAAPSMVLLYAGLESSAAGEVVQALEARGTTYQIRGSSIFVADDQRDQLRMTLASEGLPANGSNGYELLDNLTGFGTTAQMFNAAYWRAKEGELARTMLASPSVTKARVHIANTDSNPFQRDLRPSASVSVNATGGVTNDHARALRFLVASAVAGLDPADVAIIDGSGKLISAEDTSGNAFTEDRSEGLRDRVTRLLEARVGPGNAVVEVSVETVTERESIRERTLDPGSRVLLSSDSEESSNNSKNGAGAGVTVASNLPDGDAEGGGDSSATTSQSRERMNFDVSETQREIIRAPGAVKRLSVAVLVNGVIAQDAAGEPTLELRDPDELEALRELVASAVGYNEERGDVITIKTMLFKPVAPIGTEASSSLFSMLPLDVMSLIKMAIAGVIALIMGLFVVRPILSKRALPAMPAPPLLEERPPALDGEIDDAEDTPTALTVVDDQQGQLAQAQSQEDAVERLRTLINERRDETVEVLRNWLEDEEEAR
ncbi:MAG: flagellar basal-body MS-ring/collar protein FliF [Thalassovita sp.]